MLHAVLIISSSSGLVLFSTDFLGRTLQVSVVGPPARSRAPSLAPRGPTPHRFTPCVKPRLTGPLITAMADVAKKAAGMPVSYIEMEEGAAPPTLHRGNALSMHRSGRATAAGVASLKASPASNAPPPFGPLPPQ